MIAVLFSFAAQGQPKVYDLAKRDSTHFRDFISEKKVIVIGEMHGTTEVPLFVLQLIQQLTSTQRSVTIGLEIPINYQKDIDRFMKNGDFDKLLTLDHFKYPDGRTSVAMGQLIKGLRQLKRVRVVCFDIDSSFGPEVNRDSLMGVNLSNSYKNGSMVILTGNLHATLKEGYWRPNFKSATYHFNKIRGLGSELITLNTYFGSGTIWNCMQDGCKERDASPSANLRAQYGSRDLMVVYENVDANGYTGFLYLGNVTASKPLVN